MELQIITPPVADETDLLESGLVTLTEAVSQIDEDVVAHGALGGAFGYGAHFENDVFVMRPFYWGDCDCGWMDLEDEWSEHHKHADDCYWKVSRSRIDASPLQAKREAALDARGLTAWGSAENDAAQKHVEEVCNELSRFEKHVRQELCEQHGIPWNNGYGSAVHCTCDHDRLWKEFLVEHPGHKPTCSLELPNFRHKVTGLEVRWYKWIGRDTELKGEAGVDIARVIRQCMDSLPRTDKNRI